MTNLDKDNQPLDPIEELKDSITVSEIPGELMELPIYPCRIIRVKDKILTLPRGVKTSCSGVTVRSQCKDAPDGEIALAKEDSMEETLSKWVKEAFINQLTTSDNQHPGNPYYQGKFDARIIDTKRWNEFIRKIPGESGANHRYANTKLALSSNEYQQIKDIPVVTSNTSSVLSADGRYLISKFSNGDTGITMIANESGELLPVSQWQTKREADTAKLIKTLSQEESRSIKPHSLAATKAGRIDSLGIQIELDKQQTLTVYNSDDFVITDLKDVVDFAIDKINPQKIYVVSAKGRVSVLNFKSKNGKLEITTFDLEIGASASAAIQGICLDNQNNTIIATYQLGDEYKTGIFSKTNGKLLHEINAGSSEGSPVITSNGTLIIQQEISPEGDVKQGRAFRTNLNSFDKGIVETAEEARKKEELLQRLTSEGLSDTEIATALEQIVGGQREDVRDAMLPAEEAQKKDPRIEAAKQRVTTMFAREIEEAGQDIGKLKTVRKKIDALKGGAVDPVYAQFPEIFEDIEDTIATAIEKATLQTLRQKLLELKARADIAEEYDEMKPLETEFSKAMSQRRRIQKEFNGEELGARQSLEALRGRLQSKEAELKRTIIDKLEKQWVAVETMVEEIKLIEDVDRIHESPEVKRLEDLFELIDDKDVLREWHARLSKLKTDKRNELKQREKAAEDKEKQRERDFVDSILEDLRFIDDDLDGFTEEAAIDNYQKTSPLVARIAEKADRLPKEVKDEILGNLERIFQDRKKEVKTKERIQDKDTNKAFGFPVFVPEEPRITASVRPSGRNATIGTLVFTDHLGKEWIPALGSVPIDSNDEETREAIELYREDARYALFGEGTEKVRGLVPSINKEWVIHEETEENLKRIGRLLDKQMRRQNGILILVGEAGTGKNVLADIFGHYTNREVFEFSCNKQTEKEDVQFSYEYDADKGTVKIPSNVINALQTPGAIIAFDEINTLPPGVAKLLNPLFDHRRKLILPDGRIIKAHPTVTIVGFMNPENYRGTTPLPQEVKSRARMITIEYPKVRANEALMYAPLTRSLKGLSSEEFKVLWGKIVDGTPSDIADKVDSEERATTLRNLNEMIRIANLMRDNYRQTQMGLAAHDAEVNFIFSLRDGGQVMEELDDDSALTVKEAMKDVIIAKISEPEEKTTVTTLIDNA